ncbi:MAG: hypothetical protein GX119_06630 [Syntrophomonadaceae bacterium]|nr:hypothetical protein [Syntrophomonadaceae bacterium]
MEKNVYRVPRSLLVLAVIILGAMYYYAAYVDFPTPEDTVSEFYEAYFVHDYDVAAQNISVFWAAQLLPEYAEHQPSQLLNERPTLEKEAAQFFAMVEEYNPTPTELSIKVDPNYSRTGQYGALVVYELTQADESLGREMAMLVKESDRFYILNLYPLQEEQMQDVLDFDMEALDSDLQALIKS